MGAAPYLCIAGPRGGGICILGVPHGDTPAVRGSEENFHKARVTPPSPFFSAGWPLGSEGCSSARSEAEGPIGQSRERRADGQRRQQIYIPFSSSMMIGIH